ncbi:amidohydrolase [Aureibacter tunicatorum]|uniref:Amidohydrolase 3 domain-containing protein n=1 Tax=Aureibacter tunicatorum TaxID=866807 RepID=A0AAE3XJ11_9BACT|nr:amidohydrolase [Aureibacter tunicatorum]MDR6238641.1 hypothetical protein [Aureibacter tunicatorum]BDD05428.1 putative amidohydrolase [Aureibacter tunicatorum]
MKNLKIILGLGLVLSFINLCMSMPENQADKIYINGVIHTVNGKNEIVNALAIKNEKFLALGDNDAVLTFKGPDTEIIDLKGKMVMPGIIDAHIHPDCDADNRVNISFKHNANWEKISNTIIEFSKKNPSQEWMIGGTLGWLQDDSGLIPDLNQPSHKSILDKIESQKAIALYDIGYHAMLLNSKALEMLGINKDTPNPEGGMIIKDQHGEPTGVLRETAINILLEKAEIDRGDNWIFNGLKPFMSELSSMGVTSIADAYTRSWTAEGYFELDQNNDLHCNVFGFMASPIDLGKEDAKIEQNAFIKFREYYECDKIRMNGIKYIMDGSAAGQTACMTEPFKGTSHCGHFRNPAKDVEKDIEKRDKENIVVKGHAIGDRSVRVLLDAIEKVRNDNPDGPRHSIAHCTFANPKDLHRFAKLDVVYEASPALWFPNPGCNVIENDIGKERLSWAWAIKQVDELGGTVCYGSDWPVSPTPNPWYALETMITREKPGGSKESLNPEYAVDLETALRIFTINGAYSIHMDDNTGSIEIGKYADMIVLDRNLFKTPVREIHKTNVLETIYRGNSVYQLKQ